jgi:hypothetical protein
MNYSIGINLGKEAKQSNAKPTYILQDVKINVRANKSFLSFRR